MTRFSPPDEARLFAKLPETKRAWARLAAAMKDVQDAREELQATMLDQTYDDTYIPGPPVREPWNGSMWKCWAAWALVIGVPVLVVWLVF